MPKRVLDVGNCAPDHAAIRRMLEGEFAAEVVQAHGAEDTLETLRGEPFDLVLVNRRLDRDYGDGMEIVKQIKAHPVLSRLPVMLVSNYPEHQEKAVQAGAEPGFGKSELLSAETREKLKKFLQTR